MNYEELYNDIKFIALIGVGFSKKGFIRCEIDFIKNSIENYEPSRRTV